MFMKVFMPYIIVLAVISVPIALVLNPVVQAIEKFGKSNEGFQYAFITTLMALGGIFAYYLLAVLAIVLYPPSMFVVIPSIMLVPAVIWLFVLIKRYETSLVNAIGIGITVNIIFYFAAQFLGPIITRMLQG